MQQLHDHLFGWSTMVGEQNWGNATYASYDLVRTYDPQDRIRRHYTIATVGEYYPDLNTKMADIHTM